MKLSILQFILIITFFSISSVAFANKTGPEVIDTGTIKQQLDYVINKSTTYEQYKVIKIVWVNKLKKHVLDTIQKSKTELYLSQTDIANRQKSIDSLTTFLAQTKVKLAAVIKDKNSVSFLGGEISKLAYNSIMTSIIIGLSVVLIAILVLYRRSNLVSSRIKSDLTEIKEDYSNHRKKSREREEKMARRHLDEVLKYKKQRA